MTGKEYQIIDAMLKYGGSFAKKLAEAWQAADPQNKARIEKEFGDFFARYEAMHDKTEREMNAQRENFMRGS